MHYRWSQVEADRSGINVGSWRRPLPFPDRTLRLRPTHALPHETGHLACSEDDEEEARFSACAHVYKTTDYNTFAKSGALKLTEVEMYFLNSRVTVANADEWAVVYLGISNGERFRYLRDNFFPKLTVIAFDPIDDFFTGCKDELRAQAKKWSEDGTNFFFSISCFDPDTDLEWMKEKIGSRKVLLISDIRGVAMTKDGHFDKAYDNEIQWQAIKRLNPVRSLLKFATPNPMEQFYDYIPGDILIQVYCFYGTRETRLLVDGVPTETKRYDSWEIFDRMRFHHEHLRGLVYDIGRRTTSRASMDDSFDCAVLWGTVRTYAEQNGVDPYEVLGKVMTAQCGAPRLAELEVSPKDPESLATARAQYKSDVEWALKAGRVPEAVATLEVMHGFEKAFAKDDKVGSFSWFEVADGMAESQPDLARRIRKERPSTPTDFIELLGSLADPFTLVRSELNGLLQN